MATWKIAPALSVGCTIVFKAAENTPLATLLFAELVEAAGFPKGVFNVVNGELHLLSLLLQKELGLTLLPPRRIRRRDRLGSLLPRRRRQDRLYRLDRHWTPHRRRGRSEQP